MGGGLQFVTGEEPVFQVSSDHHDHDCHDHDFYTMIVMIMIIMFMFMIMMRIMMVINDHYYCREHDDQNEVFNDVDRPLFLSLKRFALLQIFTFMQTLREFEDLNYSHFMLP